MQAYRINTIVYLRYPCKAQRKKLPNLVIVLCIIQKTFFDPFNKPNMSHKIVEYLWKHKECIYFNLYQFS